jgi:hypothetical protein
MEYRDDLDFVGKRKNLCPFRESNPGTLALQLTPSSMHGLSYRLLNFTINKRIP